MNSITTMPNYQ